MLKNAKASILLHLAVFLMTVFVVSIASAASTGLQCRSVFEVQKVTKVQWLNESVSEPRLNDILVETIESHGQITSKFTVNQTEALELGQRWMGKDYKEIGKPGSGVFLSADGHRRFRIDNNSVLGNHSPHKPHVHLELVNPITNVVISNNHIVLNSF